MSRFLLNGLTSVFVSLGLSSASHAGLATGGGYSYQGARRAGAGGYAGTMFASLATFPGAEPKPSKWARAEATSTKIEQLEIANATAIRELVIIDAAVPEKHQIYEKREPGVAFATLRAGEDGLAQLRAILSRYRDLRALHVFSHAEDGAFYLGDSVVTKVTLSREINTLASLDQAMQDGADVMFYGCNLARGAKGEALLELVSAAAHVDVAASNDLTGSERLGGDWDLEIKKGDIDAKPRFDSIAMVDFTAVLPYTGTLGLGSVTPGYANAKSYTIGGTSYTIKFKSGGSGSKDLYNYSAGYIYIGTRDSTQTSSSVYFTSGETFSLNSLYVYHGFGAPTKTIRVTSSKGGTQDSTGPVAASSGATINFSGAQWTDITSFTVQYSDNASLDWLKLDNISIANLQSSMDSDGTLVASAVVTEPVGLNSTVDTTGEAVDLFDFTLTDGGGGDSLPMTVSQIVINVSGTSTDTERDNIVWRLNGNDASNVTGVYDGAFDTITFSSLSISVADNTSETYTVNGYYGTPSGLTEDHTVILSVDGDSDLVVGSSGTQMASGQSAVTNGSGTTLDVTASQLTFSTQPAGSTSGLALTTQPVVAATDIFSNVDVDYVSDISLSESSSGILSGTTTKTPVSGVATFTNVVYTASADQEDFALTAAASGLSDGTSNTVTSDVVATQLRFSTQPAPTSIDSGSSTSFTTVPVVQAVDGSNTLDAGYSTDIVLSVTDPNDSVLDGTVNSMSGTGDGDGSGTTVTLTPSSGSATFTNLALQYTNGGATDTIALQAASGGLSSANSSAITSTINNAPVISNLNGDAVSWAGVGGTVNLDSGGDASGSDTELDALNGGNGDYSGGTLTVQRVGGAVTSDLFGFDTSGAAFTVNGSDLQSSGQSFASFTNANGVLSITFNSASTTATTALVSNVMSRITYRNDTPGGDASVRFTLSDGSKSTTADASVQSDSIYITNTTDTASIDQTDGVSFSEAIAIANADATGTQTLILASALAGQTISATSASSLAESLTLDLDSATGATISGGTLTLGGGVTLTMNNGSGDTGAIGTLFAGTGSLSKTGAGALTLTGVQTYSGTTTISAGALSIASDSNVGSGQLVLNGGTLAVTGSTTINNAINIAADSTLSVSTDITASGLFSGSNTLTKTGAAKLTLTNTGNEASYSGAMTVSAGTLSISSDENLSSGVITLDSGTLTLSGATFTVDNSIVLGAGGGTVGAVSGAKVLSGVISGSGSFGKIGGPALTLSGANTFSGGASVNGVNGLIITDSSNLGSGNVTLKLNSLLSVTGSGVTIANNLTMEDNATLSNANDITWSGVISGSGTLSKSGAGTLTLSGSQTQTGGLNITAGSVSIAGDGNLGSGTLTLDGGSLIVTGSGITVDNALSLGASNGTISHANALTWSGVISGSGGLTKTGAGTLTLSATNTNTGSIALSAGTLDVSGAVGGAVNVASGTTLQGQGSISGLVTVNSGATLQIGSSPGDLTLGNGLTVNSGGALVARINGTTAGSGYDQYNVTGAVTLGGTLSVLGSYSGSGGDSFTIISNDASDAVSGIFNGLSEGDKSTTLNGVPLTVSYLGSSGNDVTLSVIPPTVTDAKISISGASGTSGAYKIGDTVTATWDDTGSGDNNGDITGVNVNFSAFGGGSSVAASNSANTWTATYIITAGAVDGTNLNVSVTATDSDGVSKTTADTTNATVDNIAPTVTSGNISLSGGSGTSGAYKTGDIVTATWNNTTGGENNSDTISGVSVDFSAFGGSSVAASNSSDTWTATYTILAGAVDSTNLNVSVTATDNAGNTKTTSGSDNVTVDNIAPTLTDAKVSISGSSGISGAYIIGDIVTATWDDTAATGDNNSDTISAVSVNFTAFGGGAAVSASNSSDTWTASYTLVAGAIDSSNLNISVTATDNAGNTALVADTSNATVDTQAPTVSSVTSSTANGSYKAGDAVSIQILFDQSVIVSGAPQLQLETGATDRNVSYASGSGGATLNFAYTVQSGDTSADLDYTGTGALGLNGGTIVDDAGNAATLTLAAPGAANSLGANKALVIDTTAPSLSLITPVTTPTSDNTPDITFSTDEAGALSLGGSCGTSSSTTISSTGNHSITLTQTDNSSALGDGTYSDCTVTVTDAVGNASTALAITAFTVDTTAPSGHSVSLDDSTVNASEAASQSFTFASAEVGASYSYSISSSGGGTAVTGSGTIASASQQVTGLNLSGLNDGTLTLSVTLTDPAGNAATAVTDTATMDKTAPTGHSVSFDDGVISATEATSQSFTFASAEVGASYSYSISSSGGGTAVTGSGSVTGANQQIASLDLSGLNDGTLTLSVTLTDTAGNAAMAVTDTATLDKTAPSGHSVSFDDSTISSTEATSQSFTFASAEVGASYSYSISSSGGGTAVTGSGSVTGASQQIASLDLSGLNDGTLTLSVTLTDTAGNAATAVTDTATLDKTAPSGHSVSFDDSTINATEAASQSFTFASAEVGASYSYSISSSGGGTSVTGSGTVSSAGQQHTDINVSGLNDGTLTLSVTLTDPAGNAATAVTNTSTLDKSAPTGHSVSFDDSVINASEAASQSFTFASAEVGASYSYSISSAGGGTPVTGSGSISSASQQISGINLSGLSDGTLTLSVTLTDAAGNAATAVTNTASLDQTAPSGQSVSFDDSVINASEASSQSITFASAEVGASFSYSVSSSGGGTPVTGSGTVTSAGQQVSSLNLSGLNDGTLTLSVTLTDTAGNAASAVTNTATLDQTAPSGHSVSFDDSTINASEASSQSFTFASAEVGASYSYSISSSGGGTAVNGSGTIASASQQIASLDLSGLADGTLTLSVTLTDTAGNAATAVTNTAALDATTPSGHSVSFDDGTINATEAASQSFTFASAEAGATFSYSIASSGGGANVTGSGSITSAAQQVTGVNVSGLSDGTLTLSVVVTDASGNAATAVTANATLDATAPTLAETTAVVTPTSDTTPNAGFSTTEAGALAVGGSCGSAAEGAAPSGTQTITLTGTDNSSALADGTYSDCTLTVTDAAGNASSALTLTSFTVDSTAPSGFSVAFSDTIINASEASASAFAFTSGETGADYNYSVTSSGGGTAVTGSGTLSSASQSIALASLSGLSDGALTLSVTLTDVTGNVSAAQTAAATLDTTAPAPSLSSTASAPTNAAFTVAISFGETVSGFVVSDIVAGNASLSGFTDNGGGSYSVTATPSADGAVTLDISASVAQDTAGNNNAAATQFSIVYDGTAPTPVISSSASNPTNAAFTAAIAFGESVSGFAVSDIVASNASLSGFTDNSSGNYSVTVTPTADGSVTLDIAASAAQDNAGNNSAAATQFSLSYDGSGPTLASSTPANGAVDVEYNATLSLTFDEEVAIGGGSATQISLYRSADDELVEAIEVSSAQVVISGATVTVDPTDNFTPNQGYYVRIGAEALTDTLGNAYAGLTSGLSFTVGNHVPEAAADTATTDEDVAVSIKVLDNDSDLDSQLNPASVLVTVASEHGSVSVNTGSGVITYEPDADYNGADSFSYTVEDVHGGISSAALVSITVEAVNDAPVAVADVSSTNEDTLVTIDVAANDTDIDDAVDASTLALVATPSHGAAVLNAGKIDYTPAADFNGSDSFTYTVKDESGALSNVATVIVNVVGVNDVPSAANDSVTTDEDTAVDIAVLDNDVDVDGSLQASTVTIIATASHGSVSVNTSTGVIQYEPTANFNGSDSFTYIVKDNEGAASNIATVAITVNSVNDAPVAVDDAAMLLEDSAHTINVLGNDSDVDGALQPATVEIVDAPLYGSVSINASTGAISYTPSTDFSGIDQFTYRVQDESGAWSNSAVVALTIEALNDAPLANNDSATTNEDIAVVIEVLDNDQDVDGVLDASAISIESAPGMGAVTDNGDGTLTYTPDANVFGVDSFEYSVKDDAGDSSNTATVMIAIAPVNDAPMISGSPTTSILEGQAYSFTPTLVDVDSGALTVTATNRPSWLSLNAATGALTGTPAVGGAGVYSGIVLSVSDGQASASLAAFSITVIGDNDTDGVANDVDTDDDNDGMSDSFELLYGFNPFDSNDAAGDLDGDTISNYQEFVDNTNPNDANDYVDTTPPVVVAPEDITIDAIALYTPVTLRQMLGLASNASDSDVEAMLAVLATDNVDGDNCCSVRAQGLLNNTVLLPPGRNLITYRGVDRKGNAATAMQVINIRPLVSVNKDQISVEGATVQFRVILNGQSPFYPLTVPYVIDSLSTASSSDHNLVDGSVTFTKSGNIGQTEVSVSIALTADSITENDERLIIRLDDRTTNAEDLAGGYDPTNIYDINAGAKIRHVITIVERNVAPDVTLRLRQNGVDAIQVTPDGGLVTVVATVTDPNPGDTHTYNWSATDNALVDTDGNTGNAQLVFSPVSLASGRYKVQLTVADASNATDEARLYFRVVAALPTLDPTVDSDGDGVNDAEEGVADGDDDGIPDYLDNITATNVLPEVASETSSYLVECDPGVRCRLGQFAILGANGGARLEPEELPSLPDINTDDLFEPQGGVFDFEVHELATLGQSVRVVLPQDQPLPANGVYRKFQNNNWTTFVVDANNELHSAPGNPGYCPPPGDDSWETGLISGYYCLQLTIEDGGPNDADGLVNAAVEDPGVVAVDKRTPSDIDSEGGGSGGGAINWTLLLALLGLSILSRRCLPLRASVLAVFLVVSLGAPDASQAADWETMKARLQERGYLEFGAYHVSGSQEAGEFKRGLENEDVTVSINNYDVSRYGYQFLAGYRYHEHMAAEIGFLDLGNVKVSMSASALTPGALEDAVEKNYPVSGSGWTLSNRFFWPVREKITLSAEVGLFLWEGDIQLSGADINPDLKGDTDPLLGLGLNYRLHKNIDASVRLKRAFFDGQHADLMGVGVIWRFKGY
ncbi:tandem-95 repeat protein [Hahella sp. KA22]|uniref:tandem-95 repeat protein n=1 Tax=Hahella sp. KA22 TaxID=1628392 RepID=UPI000FDD5CDD|nr:tandem-95 repeat protein [Hahella sp. KA22]AZZ92667.1 tandem-95 repeat protein [Hahella sp. KA22]QAY56040.1 tandem-95 repeat protein [Hahella sp. KA22]